MNISSIRVSFEYLFAGKKESLTFVPETRIDEINGIEYISRLFCLEQQKDYICDPFVTKDILPGILQSYFPAARIEIITSANKLS